mgnify:CR=1 FL=1
MSIAYTYEIVAVNAEARCMEIVYTADGHPTMRIGARLPFEGETLESVVGMHAPVRYWEELKAPVVVPQVGFSGSVAPAPIAEAPTPQTPGPLYRDLVDLNV